MTRGQILFIGYIIIWGILAIIIATIGMITGHFIIDSTLFSGVMIGVALIYAAFLAFSKRFNKWCNKDVNLSKFAKH